MMRKILTLCLLVILAFALPVYAADKARVGAIRGMEKGITGVTGIADLSSGDAAEVDTSGNLLVEIRNNTNSAAVDSSGNLAVEVFNGTNQQAIDSSGNAAVELFNGTNQAAIDSSGNVAMELFDGTNQVDVDADGSLETKEMPKSYRAMQADTAVVTGAATVFGVIVTSDVAGDYALIYDATSATGLPEFDVMVGTADDTKVLSIPCGVTFSNGIYVDIKDAGTFCTVIYDS